jgi:hypothetical protein
VGGEEEVEEGGGGENQKDEGMWAYSVMQHRLMQNKTINVYKHGALFYFYFFDGVICSFAGTLLARCNKLKNVTSTSRFSVISAAAILCTRCKNSLYHPPCGAVFSLMSFFF